MESTIAVDERVLSKRQRRHRVWNHWLRGDSVLGIADDMKMSWAATKQIVESMKESVQDAMSQTIRSTDWTVEPAISHYARECLGGYCQYATGYSLSERWAALKFTWHKLFCRWARWPMAKRLPVRRPGRCYIVRLAHVRLRKGKSEYTL